MTESKRERQRKAIREKLEGVMREEEEWEEGERQTLEIVGVLEKRGVWNERVNLQRNRLASHPSFPVLQSKAQIQHSETHMLSLTYTYIHTHGHPHTIEEKTHMVNTQACSLYHEFAHAKFTPTGKEGNPVPSHTYTGMDVYTVDYMLLYTSFSGSLLCSIFATKTLWVTRE